MLEAKADFCCFPSSNRC